MQIEFETGERLSLVLKDLSPSSQLEEARRVRPGFLYDPAREAGMYQKLLEPKLFDTAICYGSVTRKDIERYWLFLERVQGPLLWQVGRFEQWKSAARWLARFHSHFSKNKRQRITSRLVCHDAAYYLRWMERAERFGTGSRSSNAREFKAGFKRIGKAYPCAVKHLLQLPRTIIHGEFYPSNVIVRHRDGQKQICPIDWEVAGLGPGLIDLAALVSGTWDEDALKALGMAYREEFALRTGTLLTMPELLESVAYCQLYLSVQWLGWASDWSPPGEHEQDWLHEAVRLCDHLGL